MPDHLTVYTGSLDPTDKKLTVPFHARKRKITVKHPRRGENPRLGRERAKNLIRSKNRRLRKDFTIFL